MYNSPGNFLRHFRELTDKFYRELVIIFKLVIHCCFDSKFYTDFWFHATDVASKKTGSFKKNWFLKKKLIGFLQKKLLGS